MQSSPIYIPTDSSYAELGSQCLSPKTDTSAQEPDEFENSVLDYTDRSYTSTRKKTHYGESASSPAEKLSKAQLLSEQYIKDNEFLRANKELIRCVALSRIVHGDGHWKLAQAFANLGHSYLIFRELPAQARQHAESAKNILLRGVDMSNSVEDKREILETLVTIYYTLGIAHLQQNNGKESYLSLQKVEKIVEELDELQETKSVMLKISEKDIAVALGMACLQQNKPSSARNYFEQAVNLVIASEGDSAPELIDLYRNLAKTEQLRKKHDKAIEYLLQAVSISHATYNKPSIESAETELLLAKAYAASGNSNYEEAAEKCFKESLGVYQTVLGPDDQLTLNACIEYSKWLIQIGNKKEAYSLLHEAMISDAEFSEIGADILSIMGSICLSDGNVVKGYKLLKKCLGIQTVVYGTQHTKSRETQKILDTLKKSGGIKE
ncbi:tetratricopeptide repeat 23-like [Pelobates cultripes]|uniref:Tetratricopeptide repeat 23-like n=2 Tax=Pelobates cultripes TaxID=61616 RepID=A0AAD1SDV5_PELCU|nr:tetratricopeptide repeat 23-like [Pelobates cultripes]